jgi:hypothetical protein
MCSQESLKRYRVNFERVDSFGIWVWANSKDEAEIKAMDSKEYTEAPELCAQCSGWFLKRMPYIDSSEWELESIELAESCDSS